MAPADEKRTIVVVFEGVRFRGLEFSGPKPAEDTFDSLRANSRQHLVLVWKWCTVAEQKRAMTGRL